MERVEVSLGADFVRGRSPGVDPGRGIDGSRDVDRDVDGECDIDREHDLRAERTASAAAGVE